MIHNLHLRLKYRQELLLWNNKNKRFVAFRSFTWVQNSDGAKILTSQRFLGFRLQLPLLAFFTIDKTCRTLELYWLYAEFGQNIDPFNYIFEYELTLKKSHVIGDFNFQLNWNSFSLTRFQLRFFPCHLQKNSY